MVLSYKHNMKKKSVCVCVCGVGNRILKNIYIYIYIFWCDETSLVSILLLHFAFSYSIVEHDPF